MAQEYLTYPPASGGASNHSELNELLWSEAGHTIDEDIDMGGYSLTNINELLGAISLTLNNGITDGGTLYFNGGVDSYLKSSADGLTLSGNTFTTYDFLTNTEATIKANEVQSKTSPIYHVKSWGVTGDGVTDDSIAINAIMSAITSSGKGATLFFPSGTYKCNSTISFGGDDIVIQGEGYNSDTIFDFSGLSSGHAFSNITAGCKIKDIEVKGPIAAIASSAVFSRSGSGNFSVFENIKIDSGKFEYLYTGQLDKTTIKNLRALNSFTVCAFNITSGAQGSIEGTILGDLSNGNTTFIKVLGNGQSIAIKNNYFVSTQNSCIGIDFDGLISGGALLENNTIDLYGNSSVGINIDIDSALGTIQLINNNVDVSTGASGTALYIKGASYPPVNLFGGIYTGSDYGIVLDDSYNVVVNGSSIFGSTDISCINGSSGNILVGVQFVHTDYSGLDVAGFSTILAPDDGAGSFYPTILKKVSEITLDNSTTDGGTLYFDGDTSSYIQSNNDGTELTIGGFSKVFLNGDLTIGASNDMDIGYSGTEGYINTDLISPSDLLIDCGTEKTIELVEPVYKDINLGQAQLASPASNNPDIDNFVDESGVDTGIETYAFAPGEKVHGEVELQHDYKEGTDIVFHIHWQGIDAPTGTDNVQWQLTYTMARGGETLDSTTVITVEQAIDTQYEFHTASFAAIVGTNFKIGDQFLFTLERIAASSAEYGGDALIATVGIHYQVNTLGSRQIFTK